MTNKEPVEVSVDAYAELWRTRERLLLEIEERREQVAQIDRIIKEQLPDKPHVLALIAGAPAFTYSYQRRWSERQFADDYPALAKEFSVPTVTHKMDWARFSEEHPALARQYQVRQLVPQRPRRHDR